MSQYEINNTTTTNMSSNVPDYSVSSKSIDEAQNGKFRWYNSKFNEYLGYYKTIPELKQAIDALARWTGGKGYTTDTRTKVILENITGWGEDSFDSIIQNMIIIKKVNGDSFAEIIRNDDGTLINIKPLNPSNIVTVVDEKGIIESYEELNKNRQKVRTYKPYQILHLSNDRVANEVHGVSVIESCKWVIDARNEAMTDWRVMLHRNLTGVRIIEVEEDNTTKLAKLSQMWETAIKNKEVLILPKGTASNVPVPSPTNPENWIRYLENFFYQAVGVPKVILGGSADYTEASSKVGYLTFEQVYMSEQRILEQDLWNQLALRIKFERPVSLKEDIQTSEAANTGQVGFQKNEVTAQMGRVE